MLARLCTSPTRLHTEQFNIGSGDQRMKHSGCIAAAADTCHDEIRKTPDLLFALTNRLAADDRLEVTHDSRKWVRADHGAEDVVRMLHA